MKIKKMDDDAGLPKLHDGDDDDDDVDDSGVNLV